MGKVRAVLFDVDGTLVKAGGAGRKALDRAILKLHGVEDVCSRFSISGRMDIDNFRLAFFHATKQKAGPGEIEAIETAYLRFLPGEVRNAVKTGVYNEIAGVSKLIDLLSRRKGVLLGLGTGNVEEGAKIKLKPSGLLKYFQFGGYGKDAVSRAQMLRVSRRRAEALAKERIEPRDVCVIGDTPRDVQAGRKAGFRTGAVLDGFGDEAAVRNARPDFLAKDFLHLRTWIDWICK